MRIFKMIKNSKEKNNIYKFYFLFGILFVVLFLENNFITGYAEEYEIDENSICYSDDYSYMKFVFSKVYISENDEAYEGISNNYYEIKGIKIDDNDVNFNKCENYYILLDSSMSDGNFSNALQEIEAFISNKEDYKECKVYYVNNNSLYVVTINKNDEQNKIDAISKWENTDEEIVWDEAIINLYDEISEDDDFSAVIFISSDEILHAYKEELRDLDDKFNYICCEWLCTDNKNEDEKEYLWIDFLSGAYSNWNDLINVIDNTYIVSCTDGYIFSEKYTVNYDMEIYNKFGNVIFSYPIYLAENEKTASATDAGENDTSENGDREAYEKEKSEASEGSENNKLSKGLVRDNLISIVAILATILSLILIIAVWITRIKRKRKKKIKESSGKKENEKNNIDSKIIMLRVLGNNGCVISERVKGSVIVGRSDLSEIFINEPSISRQHFAIEYDGENFYIQNLSTTNGTKLNGITLDTKRQLKPEDKITAGSVDIIVRW